MKKSHNKVILMQYGDQLFVHFSGTVY